jgi:hypothetical protein
VVLAATAAHAEAPLSAIDWLSQSVAQPPATVVVPPDPAASDPAAEPISVAPIEGTSIDSIGLLPVSRSGLPRNLWGQSATSAIVRLIRAERIDTLPALRGLLLTLLIAEIAPPVDGDRDGAVFVARIDKLLDMGALDQALALLDLVERPDAEVFRRSFDAALLLGQEDKACARMRESPDIAPTFPARIFCLARGGDWAAAALSLRTGEALGFIPPEEAALIARFLDPELFEGEPDLPAPQRPTPLVLRMMEAVGQPVPTGALPVAFAHADLGPASGWKMRIEAAERLARTGVLDANRLLGLYTEQRPAASGGVWDRVAAIRLLDAAVSAGDPAAVSAALPVAWDQMARVELEVPLATLYGAALARLPLTGKASALAFRIGLLSQSYEAVASARVPQDGVEAFLKGLARGDVDALAPPDQLGGAVKDAFDPDASLAPEFAALVDGERLGEAILVAIDKVTNGVRGDLRQVTQGLLLFRKIGLDTVARRAALELLLLERRG